MIKLGWYVEALGKYNHDDPGQWRVWSQGLAETYAQKLARENRTPHIIREVAFVHVRGAGWQEATEAARVQVWHLLNEWARVHQWPADILARELARPIDEALTVCGEWVDTGRARLVEPSGVSILMDAGAFLNTGFQ
jgi:hypothetical protein